MAESTIPQTAADATPVGMKAKLPVLLAVACGLAVGLGTGAAFVGPAAAKALGFGLPDPSTYSAQAIEEEEDPDADSMAKAGAAPAVLTLENMVLNPSGTGGSRFLLLSVAIEASSSNAVSTLQARDPELKDVVLSTLARKTVDELSDVAQRENIKTELVDALNERFGKKTVLRVYFPQYVVQ